MPKSEGAPMTMTKTTGILFGALMGLVASLAGPACGSSDDSGGEDAACLAGGKCDTPAGQGMACLQREAEVLQSSNRGYTHDLIRWACADVEGVTADGWQKDDRGQEYCE